MSTQSEIIKRAKAQDNYLEALENFQIFCADRGIPFKWAAIRAFAKYIASGSPESSSEQDQYSLQQCAAQISELNICCESLKRDSESIKQKNADLEILNLTLKRELMLRPRPEGRPKIPLVCDQMPGRRFTADEAAREAGTTLSTIHKSIRRGHNAGKARLRFRRMEFETETA